MFLPPYSPDFNPIEQVFAKLKALLRKAAARTIDTLEAAIATALDAFTPVNAPTILQTRVTSRIDPKILGPDDVLV